MLFYLFRDHGFVDITTFVAAMIISLETITTVGYSVSDINFGLFFSLASLSGDHTLAFFLLYGEMMQAILMNSFCIGIVYTRLSRAIVLLSLPSLSRRLALVPSSSPTKPSSSESTASGASSSRSASSASTSSSRAAFPATPCRKPSTTPAACPSK